MFINHIDDGEANITEYRNCDYPNYHHNFLVNIEVNYDKCVMHQLCLNVHMHRVIDLKIMFPHTYGQLLSYIIVYHTLKLIKCPILS